MPLFRSENRASHRLGALPAAATGIEANPLLSRGQRILRLLGGVLLTICAVMFVLGLTIWGDDLAGPLFVYYWSWCFLLAMGTVLVALADMLLVRRRFHQRRRELFREEFMTDELIEQMRDAIKQDEPK